MTSPGLRDTVRLAATVTVVNGFASLTGLPFALYASLAVLSVTVGNYGNTLELGRQRLVGTAVGAVVVFFGYRAWGICRWWWHCRWRCCWPGCSPARCGSRWATPCAASLW